MWLVFHPLQTGFTIGIGDCVPDKATSEKIQVAIDNAKEGVTGVIKSLHTGRLEKKPGLTLLESFEALVNEKLNSARDNAGLGTFSPHHFFFCRSVDSGTSS